MAVGRARAWWLAGGALVGGGAVWVVLRFGVPVVLTDEKHPVRPALEALSWIAGIGGLVVAAVALVVALRQGRRDHAGTGHTTSAAAPRTASAAGNVTGSGAITAGVVIGPVVQGDVVVGGAGVPAVESISADPALSRVPAGSELFVGRARELERLRAAVAGPGRAVVAVHGLGGVGKSALVARFARSRVDRCSLVWWITADSASAIDTGLADLAATLAPQSADLPVEQRAELALRWLATHDGWLLALDDLTGLGDAAGLLERVRTGTIVITSRRGGGWRGVEAIPLDVLPRDHAVELLARGVRSEWPDADLTHADRLCEELGRLPLAVEQAGAYLARTRITPTAYLDLLRRYPARMFGTTADGGDAQRTAARVWHVTLDRLADTPSAGRLLRRLAWCAPDSILRVLVTAIADEPEPDVLEALGRLAAYSMITLDTDAITVHRLVQAVTRTPDPTDPHRLPEDITHARDATATTLLQVLTGVDHRLPADWPVYELVLTHARVLLDHTPADSDTEALCGLANNLGLYVAGQGDATTALAWLGRAARGSERLHGPDHPETLGSRNNLASAYRAAGDLERAIPLHEATLADAGRVFGPDHPTTLALRVNLAEAYRVAGDTGRAVPLVEATLADSERVLGPDHPTTLTSRNNLACAYLTAGDAGRAIPLYEATVADRQRVLGPDHPNTLGSRINLAVAHRAAGDLERATPLLEAALADTERVLGPDHPVTRAVRSHFEGTT